MKKLTAREFILVYTAGILMLACAAFWLVHVTAYAYYGKAENHLEFVKMESLMAQNDLNSKEELEHQLSEGKEYYDAHRSQVGPLKSEAEIESEILSVAAACGLDIEGTDVEPVESMEADGDMEGIYTGRVTLTVRGTYDSISSFTVCIEEKKDMKIEEFHLNGAEEGYQASIAITCYMADLEQLDGIWEEHQEELHAAANR